MTRDESSGVLVVTLGLGAFALVAVGVLIAKPCLDALSRPVEAGVYDVRQMVFVYATLPRLTMAVLAGAGLGASGAVLQHVLRNPLASPTTLGIDGGARLAIGLATLFSPSLLGLGRDAVAIAGSVAALLVVLGLVKRRELSPLSLVLAGLVVSLYCGALGSILVLLKDRYLASLLIWGSGSLCQQSWGPARALVWRLAFTIPPLVLLVRPLAVLDLGDESARSLGVPVARLRAIAVGIAVLLAAFVTSAVGVIGFIGLVAPILARLAGARGFAVQLPLSAVVGALLLLLTDAVLQSIAGASVDFIPTGAVTAVLGSPLLLWLLPRLKSAPMSIRAAPRHFRRSPSARALVLGITALLFVLAAAVLIGRGPAADWRVATVHALPTILEWRLPRVLSSLSAGALLGVSGVVLQRLTSNEMASPEILGVSAGAVLAVTFSLFAFGGLGRLGDGVMATGGALAVIAAMLAVGRRSGFAPERVLLAGVALNALIDAIVGVVSASGDPRAIALLAWMAGSTNGTSLRDALVGSAAAALVIAVTFLSGRWLLVLPLGDSVSRALGVPLARARWTLLLLAAVASAAATLIVGPLSFVGLMAPHAVTALSVHRPVPALIGAALVGGGLMAIADWVARTVAFPVQLPTGLVAALVGAPFLLVLLRRGGA